MGENKMAVQKIAFWQVGIQITFLGLYE